MSEKSFYQNVYKIVRLIPAGQVATYGQIGKIAGCSPRQVGTALSVLSVKDVKDVPWHRVINSQGRISLRSEGGGATHQAKALQKEQVNFSTLGKIDLKEYQWPGPFEPFEPAG